MSLRHTLLCVSLFVSHAFAQQALRTSVSLVAAPGAASDRLVEVLGADGFKVRRIAAAECTAELLRTAGVVVVAWPDTMAVTGAAPLGPLVRWDRPTVFVGECGDRFAAAWALPTRAQLTAALGEPSLVQVELGASAGAAPRLGHLLFVTEEQARVEGALACAVEAAARGASDRPVWRCAPIPSAGAELRERAAGMGVHIDVLTEVESLTKRLGGDGAAEAEQLLLALLPGGPGAGTTTQDWGNWLRRSRRGLCWDPLSDCFRTDELAFWSGQSPEQLRGERRLGNPAPDAEATAIATRVVEHHGGAALRDLSTFTCWQDSTHLTWDRVHGVLRVENHHQPPANARSRGIAWTVSVFDTAADEQLIWGGGPPPRPRIGARATYRELLERCFLPVLLLQPGYGLRVLGDESGDREVALAVRMAGRAVDLESEFVMFVDRDSGAVHAIEQRWEKRDSVRWDLIETSACGPLTLPTKWRRENTRRDVGWAIEQPAWNPDLPADIATATERLFAPRRG